MLSPLQIRELHYADVPALAEIVGQLWQFNQTNRGLNESAARVYLRTCLTQQNYVRVAVWEHQVVRAILADTKYRKKERAYDLWQLAVAKTALAVRPGGWQLLRQLRERGTIDDHLLSSLQRHEFLGEIVLLMVDPEYQNLGIGHQLVQTVAEYWDTAPVDKVYLFTAAERVGRFYRQQGFQESQREQVDWPAADQPRQLAGYLYTGHVSDLATAPKHYLSKE